MALSSIDVIRQVWTQASLPLEVLENTVAAGNVVLHHDPGRKGIRRLLGQVFNSLRSRKG